MAKTDKKEDFEFDAILGRNTDEINIPKAQTSRKSKSITPSKKRVTQIKKVNQPVKNERQQYRLVRIKEETIVYFEDVAFKNRQRNFGALVNEVLEQYIKQQKDGTR